MLARKSHKDAPKDFPEDWLEEVTQILKTVYFDKFKNDSRTFGVWGHIYPSELLLIISLADNFNPASIPTTLFLSVDVDPKVKMKPVLNKLLDASGTFFDTYFRSGQNDDESLYLANWDEAEIGKQVFFYKVTRENISQTLEADKLLREDGFFDESLDSDEEETEH